MTAKDAIKASKELSTGLVETYLSDLSDSDLMLRPVPGANHIAWQLGHLIASEHEMVTALGHEMPALPAGFAEAHSKEASSSDDAGKFKRKDEYLKLMGQMHQAALAALEKVNEADLEKPGPEAWRAYAPTVAAVWNIVASHSMMHAGQFAVVRRKLGKPVLI